MIDRVLKLVVTLTLVLFLVQALIGVLVRSLEAILDGALTALGTSAGIFSQVLLAVTVFTFFVGVLVRLYNLASAPSPRAARERASRERAMRRNARRPAEDVPPVEYRRAEIADPDPAIGEEVDR